MESQNWGLQESWPGSYKLTVDRQPKIPRLNQNLWVQLWARRGIQHEFRAPFGCVGRLKRGARASLQEEAG